MKKGEFPPGWDIDRVNRILEGYEQKMLAAREKYGAKGNSNKNTIEVPAELLPKIQKLIEEYEAA